MLITIVLDYAGGTYLSQVEVQDPSELPSRLVDAVNWESLSPSPLPSMVSKYIESVAKSSVGEMSGLKQVWCMSGMIGGELALIHAVNTVVAE